MSDEMDDRPQNSESDDLRGTVPTFVSVDAALHDETKDADVRTIEVTVSSNDDDNDGKRNEKVETSQLDESVKEQALRRMLLSRQKDLSDKNCETANEKPSSSNESSRADSSDNKSAKSLRSSKRWEAYSAPASQQTAGPESAAATADPNTNSDAVSRPSESAAVDSNAEPLKPRERKRRSGWDVSTGHRSPLMFFTAVQKR